MRIAYRKNALVIREYQLDIGTVQVYKDYMVSIFDEGATLTLERAYQIIGISEIHFRDKDFGYISLRRNSYAVDPTIYNYLRGMENLKAFAIVSKKEIDMHNFKIEKLFYKKNMEFFIEFENAVTWVKKRLKSSNRKKNKKQSS
nr:STAS/SEC14 domain-containing protein [Allomuricauda sp.]